MRRMLLPMACLLLASVVGCHVTQGHCDCDDPPTMRHVGATAADLGAVAPRPANVEPIKEMPRVTPDKE